MPGPHTDFRVFPGSSGERISILHISGLRNEWKHPTHWIHTEACERGGRLETINVLFISRLSPDKSLISNDTKLSDRISFLSNVIIFPDPKRSPPRKLASTYFIQKDTAIPIANATMNAKTQLPLTENPSILAAEDDVVLCPPAV